jgi:hypothetical protein
VLGYNPFIRNESTSSVFDIVLLLERRYVPILSSVNILFLVKCRGHQLDTGTTEAGCDQLEDVTNARLNQEHGTEGTHL